MAMDLFPVGTLAWSTTVGDFIGHRFQRVSRWIFGYASATPLILLLYTSTRLNLSEKKTKMGEIHIRFSFF